jgi:uncharacterized protein YecE (DUF72 family)
LPDDVVDECWERFRHAISPLAQAGRLGAVIVRFPSWFRPGPSAWEELAALRVRLPGFRVAVEIGNHRWFAGDACDRTLALLEGLGLCFVCQDRAGPARPVVAATGDVALVRFSGRSPHTWDAPGPGAVADGLGGSQAEDGPGAAVAWWSYRYSQAELAAWVPAVRDLASGTDEVHLIMDNCWRADAVDNASTLLQLVARP